jgi:hypothetical protein
MPIEIEIVKAFLQALASGGIAGLLGYMKQENLPLSWKAIFTKEFWSHFEPTKAIKTILVSAIVYGVAFATGMTPTTIEGLGVMTTIVYAVDALVKVIVRRTPLVRLWNAVKAKFQEIYG